MEHVGDATINTRIRFKKLLRFALGWHCTKNGSLVLSEIPVVGELNSYFFHFFDPDVARVAR